jgi:hypothetical protein
MHLGELRLVLSYEQPEVEEVEEEEEESFLELQEALALASPSSEHRVQILKELRKRRLVRRAMEGLSINRRGGATRLPTPASGYTMSTPSLTLPGGL